MFELLNCRLLAQKYTTYPVKLRQQTILHTAQVLAAQQVGLLCIRVESHVESPKAVTSVDKQQG